MRADRMRASSAVQPEHARRAARRRWNAAVARREAGAAREACRRSAGSRAKQAGATPSHLSPRQVCASASAYGHVRMTVQGPGVVRMGNPLSGMFPQLPYLAPGSIPASTDGRGAAHAPPIRCMAKPLKLWCNGVTAPSIAELLPQRAGWRGVLARRRLRRRVTLDGGPSAPPGHILAEVGDAHFVRGDRRCIWRAWYSIGLWPYGWWVCVWGGGRSRLARDTPCHLGRGPGSGLLSTSLLPPAL